MNYGTACQLLTKRVNAPDFCEYIVQNGRNWWCGMNQCTDLETDGWQVD